MKPRGKPLIALVLLVICIIIHFYSASEARVENGYSTHFSPAFSRFLRSIFGWIPFSIGDFLYGSFILWLLIKLIKWVGRKWSKKQGERRPLTARLFSLFFFCSILYIIFNLFWGINYNRKGIASQLGLTTEKYTTEDLRQMNGLLVDKVNESKRKLITENIKYPGNKELFSKVSSAYATVSQTSSFLKYQPASLKSSMWGWLGNYTGFTGYYNPFTGEAQVNTSVPKFLQPYIACHEVAHQLGYAKEMEANFVGYLAAAASKDPLLEYSCYLDLMTYTNRNLFLVDSVSAITYRKELIPEVRADLLEWRTFNLAHQSWAEPVIRWIYGKYLEGNKQPQGVLSYDEVTAFIIAYFKKFGRI